MNYFSFQALGLLERSNARRSIVIWTAARSKDYIKHK